MTSVAADAYDHVRTKILRGDFAAGSHLAELPLAGSLGVSRPTMRTALLQLAERGMLASDGRGLHVAQMTPDQVRDALQARAVLEGLSARLAAVRVRDGYIAPVAIRRLEALADEADATTRTGDLPAGAQANRAFHAGVVVLSENASCRDALERLWDQLMAATVSSLRAPERPDLVDREHRELLGALSAGNVRAAAAAARRHVRSTIEALG